MTSSLRKLTFDPKPGVASDVACLIAGTALEHPRVLPEILEVKFSVPFGAELDGLPSHVVDMQGVVGKYGVADCRDVGEGNGVPIPDNVSVKLFSISISLGNQTGTCR